MTQADQEVILAPLRSSVKEQVRDASRKFTLQFYGFASESGTLCGCTMFALYCMSFHSL